MRAHIKYSNNLKVAKATVFSLRGDDIVCHLFVLSICGYALSSGISVLLDIDNRVLSYLYRGVLFCLSFMVVFNLGTKNKVAYSGDLLVLLFLFWAAYTIRLLVDVYLGDSYLALNAEVYFLVAYGGCLIPMLALMRKYNERVLCKARDMILYFASSAVILHLFVYFSEREINITRFQTDYLNPISFGHLGATISLVAISLMYSKALYTRVHAIVTLGLLCLGLFSLAASASRGPVISFVGAMLFLYFASGISRKLGIKVASIIIFSIGSLFLASTYVETEFGFITVSRINSMLSGSKDLSIIERRNTISGAFRQFKESPIVGSSIEEHESGFYPHNIFVEGLLSTGMLGGVPLILLILLTLSKAFTLVRRYPSLSFIPLLFVQYSIGAMFSGSLWSNTIFWNLLGAVLGLVALDSNGVKKGCRSGRERLYVKKK